MPYATSGKTAAPPRIRANRTAMRRNSERHRVSQLSFAVCPIPAGRQSRRLVTMSRPGSVWTSNFVLTARARSLQARKIAGGSSMNARWNYETPALLSLLIGGMPDHVESLVDRLAANPAPVKVAARMPEPVRPNEWRPAEGVGQPGIEIATPHTRKRLIHRQHLKVQLDPDLAELTLEQQRQSLVRGVSDQACESNWLVRDDALRIVRGPSEAADRGPSGRTTPAREQVRRVRAARP